MNTKKAKKKINPLLVEALAKAGTDDDRGSRISGALSASSKKPFLELAGLSSEEKDTGEKNEDLFALCAGNRIEELEAALEHSKEINEQNDVTFFAFKNCLSDCVMFFWNAIVDVWRSPFFPRLLITECKLM